MPDATQKRRAGSSKQTQKIGASLPKRIAGTEAAATDFTREINRDIVLGLIRLYQPASRVELARASKLQNSTVSSIVEQLLAEGWITEGEALRTARGRRPTQISLNTGRAALVADVHFGRAVVAVVDLNGRVLQSVETTLSTSVDQGVRDLAAALLRLRKQYPAYTFIGAGVCLPGRIDRAAGRLILAPNLNWNGYDLQRVLAQRLKMNVELENDANACLLSELWFGDLHGVNDAVLLAISEGVGASLLVDGNLVGGRLGMAGEVGHICYDPQGPVCGCGRHGCWEMFASSRAALRYYAELGPKGAVTEYRELTRMAEAGDPHARAAVERQAEAIGRGLRMVTAALAPDVILFAGEISLSWALVLPTLERRCREGILAGSAPRLACTGIADVMHIRGAAAVVLQRHPSYYRSRSVGRATNTHGARREAHSA